MPVAHHAESALHVVVLAPPLVAATTMTVSATTTVTGIAATAVTETALAALTTAIAT